MGCIFTYLATKRHVSSSSQNQALSAIFLYREVLVMNMPWQYVFERSKKPQCLPVLLTPIVELLPVRYISAVNQFIK